MKALKNFLLLLMIASLFAFAGCGSDGDEREDEKEEKEESNKSNRRKRMDVPSWFMDPPSAEDALYAVGYAKKNNLQMANTTSANRARDELSRQIGVKVTNMVKDFLEEAGTSDQSETIEFSQSVSKSITENFIAGSKVKEREVYEFEDGSIEVFTLVTVSLTDMGARIDEIMKDKAQAYARLQANKGFDELKKELKELNGEDPDLKPREGDPTETDE